MRDKISGFLLCVVFNLISQLLFSASGFAQAIPASAMKYRAELTRAAHVGWGLDAPVAVFAAQIHQESGWNSEAVSRVGAKGMAQFMPATARWWCEANAIASSACVPENPTWAMRALVGYDRWLYDRVRGPDEFNRLWAMLRSYNGGLGHWQQEAAIVRPVIEHLAIDGACGKAKRHPSFCPENLAYPRRILILLQPRYQTWGRSVMAPST